MPLRRLMLAFVWLALAAGAASATTFRHLDLARLTASSGEIVIGTVESTRSYWNPSRTRILTDVEVKVTRALKGGSVEHVTLTQFGGEADGVRVSVPGAPVFRARDEAVLFVWRDERGRAQVNGLGQGKFDIVTDPVSGERLVQRNLPGLAIRDARSLRATAADEAPARVTLEDFVAEIQRVVSEKEAER